MRRPLEILCPTCDAWSDAAGIAVDWRCPCGAVLPENVNVRGGQLDEIAFAFALEPAGVG